LLDWGLTYRLRANEYDETALRSILKCNNTLTSLYRQNRKEKDKELVSTGECALAVDIE